MLCQFLLCNKVNQLYIYICPISLPSCISLPPTLPIPPLQVVTKHQADLPVLCSCFPLAIYFIFGGAYMPMLFSHFLPVYPSLSPRVFKSILYICLFIPVLPLSSSEPFFLRFHIYVLAYSIFFLFLTYFTLYDKLQIHPPHYKYLNFGFFMAE